MSLSVVINTKNVAKTLERTLKSVKWADEIVVVDMKSEDETVQIAKKYTDKIFEHADVGYVEPARNFAIEKATQDWVLIVDADEEIPKTLRELIERVMQLDEKGEQIADCFYLSRKNIIFNQWVKKTGWWPDYILRFFRKGHVEWSDEIHAVPITKGVVKELPAIEKLAIIHHNYQTIEQYVERMNRYTTIQAGEIKPGKISAYRNRIFQQFSGEFLRRLFAQQGIDEGIHGLNLSLLQSMSETIKLMKVWEKTEFKEGKQNGKELITSLRNFQKELNYWLANWQVEHSKGLRKLFWRVRRKFQI